MTRNGGPPVPADESRWAGAQEGLDVLPAWPAAVAARSLLLGVDTTTGGAATNTQAGRRAGAQRHTPTLDASSSQRLPLVGGSHSGGSHPPRHPLLRAHVGVPAVRMMSDYGCPLNIITALVPATAQSHVLSSFLASLCPLNCLHAPLSCIHGVGDEAFRGGWRLQRCR